MNFGVNFSRKRALECQEFLLWPAVQLAVRRRKKKLHVFTVGAWVVGHCYQMVLWDAKIMHQLSLCTEFLTPFQTLDLLTTLNSCLDLLQKQNLVLKNVKQFCLGKIVWDFLFSFIDSECFFHCIDWKNIWLFHNIELSFDLKKCNNMYVF